MSSDLSSDLRRSLRDLERDVNAVTLAPPAAIRARGEARRRRRLATGALLVGAVFLAVGVGPWTTSGGDVAGGATSCGPRTTPTVTPGEARVVMETDATRAELDAVAARLRDLGYEPTVVDRAEAWRRFQVMYCDEPDLVAGTRPEQLPEYLVFRVASRAAFEDQREPLRRLSGVAAVIDPATDGGRSGVGSRCITATPSVDGFRVDIFLTRDSTADQHQAIAARLDSLTGVVRVDFSDQQDAYERFRALYHCEPGLLAQTRPDQLPESFIVTVTDPTTLDVVQSVIQGMPGVDTVIRQSG